MGDILQVNFRALSRDGVKVKKRTYNRKRKLKSTISLIITVDFEGFLKFGRLNIIKIVNANELKNGVSENENDKKYAENKNNPSVLLEVLNLSKKLLIF